MKKAEGYKIFLAVLAVIVLLVNMYIGISIYQANVNKNQQQLEQRQTVNPDSVRIRVE